ncbi:hypothetical protein GCM10027275_33690 [Rhabdobacter roseus]|uniref:Signal transduction histidine kinase internal region domain-containing protein n=1 Tax=Rhabdobacter roseus TaxID=1655419 RepID=A0A840TYY7_9BACT|nr:histidine kinase [Rhabdobacter roseus]MBB5285408.1 hypothetical protein [Rhabdobacter roseus]
MTTNLYKGTSVAWYFCLATSFFVLLPRLLLFFLVPSHMQPFGQVGVWDLVFHFTSNFLFALAFATLLISSLNAPYRWFSQQKKWVKNSLLVFLFFTLTELFLVGYRLFPDADLAITDIRVLYYIKNSVILLTVLAFGYFMQVAQKNHRISLENEQLKRERVKGQLEALRNQLNPHFLFNALNILNVSIATNPDEAHRIVHNLSDILRYNLKIQNQHLVLLPDELEVAQSYLALHKARFGEKLVFCFQNTVTRKKWFIIPLSLQILLENAIKHNVITSNQILRITVRVDEEEKQLVVINSVNKKANPGSTGIGLKNLGNRYRLQTGRETSLFTDEQQFIVKVPLIEAP